MLIVSTRPRRYCRRNSQRRLARLAGMVSVTGALSAQEMAWPWSCARMKKCVSVPPVRAIFSLKGGIPGGNTRRAIRTLLVVANGADPPSANRLFSKKPPATIQAGGACSNRGTTGLATTAEPVARCTRRSSASQRGSGTSSSSMNATKSAPPAVATAVLRAKGMPRRGSTTKTTSKGSRGRQSSTTGRADPSGSLSTITTTTSMPGGTSRLATPASSDARPTGRPSVSAHTATRPPSAGGDGDATSQGTPLATGPRAPDALGERPAPRRLRHRAVMGLSWFTRPRAGFALFKAC